MALSRAVPAHKHTELPALESSQPPCWHLVREDGEDGEDVEEQFIESSQLTSPSSMKQHQDDKCLRGDGGNYCMRGLNREKNKSECGPLHSRI